MGCATLGCDVRRSSSQAASDRPHAGLTSSKREVAGGPRETSSGAQVEWRDDGPEDRREGRPAQGRRGQEIEGRTRREALDRARSEVTRAAAAGGCRREDAEVPDRGEVLASHDLPCDEPDDADHGQAAIVDLLQLEPLVRGLLLVRDDLAHAKRVPRLVLRRRGDEREHVLQAHEGEEDLHQAGSRQLLQGDDGVIRDPGARGCVPDGVQARGRVEPTTTSQHGHAAVLQLCRTPLQDRLLGVALREARRVPTGVAKWASGALQTLGQSPD
mmetsp:Transcript_42968/g.109038  ORF Transcript_42968/g.109038 Transcript_42968/m.109038 type:complete len:272 (-) Transcript_42968:321-1136(-)